MSDREAKAKHTMPRGSFARHEALSRFELKDIQNLHADDLMAAQQLCGHGSTFGLWETDSKKLKKLKKHIRRIDLSKRIGDFLVKLHPEGISESLVSDEDLTEATSTLIRIGLLQRLAPVGGRKQKVKDRPLSSTTVAGSLYTLWPKIIARGLFRKATSANPDLGILCHLTAEDLREFEENEFLFREVERLETLASDGLWSDAPKRIGLQSVTNPTLSPSARKPERKSTPYPALPTEWLERIGPRVLWVVTELAPNLLKLLEQLKDPLKSEHLWGKRAPGETVSRFIADAIAREPWLDTNGNTLTPPFELQTASNWQAQRFEWPIRTWESVVTLSTIVQSAHLFIALLATAGRIGEIATLERSCIEAHADGNLSVRGRTYKLHWAPAGMSRTWPAPTALVQALGQQAALAEAWDWLPLSLTQERGAPSEAQFAEQFWISIGTSGRVSPDAEISWPDMLRLLCQRLGVDSNPGGKNVHPHRFRKTIARLAGIALWNSPLVLKQLLGHKDIEMTLHYILSDPGVREEAERILRELRIMHCAETLEELRQSISAGLPNPFGGSGGARLASAVTAYEERGNEASVAWNQTSAFELATQLTMNGSGWRLGVGFICSKLPHESGECRKGASRRGERGEPLLSNCKVNCPQRVDLPDRIDAARRRRDVEEICDGYVRIATTAIAEDQLLVASYSLQQLEMQLKDWPDLEQDYKSRHDVKAILESLYTQKERTTESAHG